MKRSIIVLAATALSIAAAPPAHDPNLNARVFDRACALVARHYWNRTATGPGWAASCARFRDAAIAASDRRGFYAGLDAALDTLNDSHVFAIDPVQVGLEHARDSGRPAAGFGFAMLPDDAGRWLVRSVRAGTAAAQGGVAPGWTVVRVNDAPVDIDYAPADGEQARFALLDRAGRPHALTLAATVEAPLPSRRAARLADDVLLVALDGFEPGDDRWLARALGEARPRRVVLDLRDNGGGDADVVARVAGLFFTTDRPLVDRVTQRHSVQRTGGASPHAFTGPLALLIGHESASGAEALAALMDESGRGITIGERTAGALTGATLYRLPDGGQLSVAEFDIRTPGGRRLEGVGLAPQVEVAPTARDRETGADPVLDRALRLLAHR